MQIELLYGKVESVKDPDRKGRVQVRCIPEMEGFAAADLPWVRPFLQDSVTKNSYKNDLPEVGSLVWVIFLDPFFKDGWYLSGVFVDGRFDFDKITQSLSKITDLSTQKYEELHFNRYEDGTIVFRNSVTKEYGVYHSSGSYTLFDKDGNVKVHSEKSVKVETKTSSVELDENGNIIATPGGTGTIQLAGDSDHLVKYTELKAIIEGINRNLDARMMIDPLSGMTGTVNPGMATALFDPMAAVNLEQMKATKVKSS